MRASTVITARSPASDTVSALERVRPPPPGRAASPAMVGSVNPASASASANARALANRSAGSLAIDLATAAATLCGTVFRRSVTGRASSATIFITIAWAVAPVCGGSPVSIS